jgi:hypothetical protein
MKFKVGDLVVPGEKFLIRRSKSRVEPLEYKIGIVVEILPNGWHANVAWVGDSRPIRIMHVDNIEKANML